MRICITCGEEKKASHFYLSGKTGFLRNTECKACHKTRTAAHKRLHPGAAETAMRDANMATGRHLTRGVTEESLLLDSPDFFL